jgi:endonuclease III
VGEAYDEHQAPAQDLLSLEWLRNAPDQVARDYLMAVNGLGRKSVGCIMLLTLGKHEFPVDTNVSRRRPTEQQPCLTASARRREVSAHRGQCLGEITSDCARACVTVQVGRICARLGWIPLDASQAVEDMDDYAPEPEVHQYLHSRLLGFDVGTLYELHYQVNEHFAAATKLCRTGHQHVSVAAKAVQHGGGG